MPEHTAARPASSSAHLTRPSYLAWASLVLILGWSARTYSRALPPFLGTYAPDTLWALLVFLLVAAVKPSLPLWRTALIALAFAYGVEFSQLYQAPWLTSLRATRLGGLVLGHGFLWSNLLCYSVGIVLGVLIAQGSRTPRACSPRNEA